MDDDVLIEVNMQEGLPSKTIVKKAGTDQQIYCRGFAARCFVDEIPTIDIYGSCVNINGVYHISKPKLWSRIKAAWKFIKTGRIDIC